MYEALQVEIRVAEGRNLSKSIRGRGVVDTQDTGEEVEVNHSKNIDKRRPTSANSRKPPNLLNAGLCVSLSLNGEHVITEQCNDVHRPTWKKISKFKYVMHSSLKSNGSISSIGSGEEIPTAAEMKDMIKSPSKKFKSVSDQSKNRKSSLSDGSDDVFFRSNSFINQNSCILSRSTHETNKQQAMNARNDTLHLRVFHDNIVSKELIGDITIDMSVLISSGGLIITSDRVGYKPDANLSKYNDNINHLSLSHFESKSLCIDTWVALRQDNGEIRVQFLIKPEISAALSAILMQNANTMKEDYIRNGHYQMVRANLSRSTSEGSNSVAFYEYESDPEYTVVVGLNGHHKYQGNVQTCNDIPMKESTSPFEPKSVRRHTFNEVHNQVFPSDNMLDAKRELKRTDSYNKKSNAPRNMWRRRPCPWASFDYASKLKCVIVSSPPWLISLTNRLRTIEEQYSYSYAFAYSQTVPNGEENFLELSEDTESNSLMNHNLYPFYLKREMLYITLREARQREAWAKCLVTFMELREAIRFPPPFRSLLAPHRGGGGRAGIRVHGLVNTPLFDLVLGGIPSSLFGENCGVEEFGEERNRQESDNSGLAFAGNVMDPLSGVKTSIPSVEVVRVSGHMCCAEYTINVSAPGGRTWTIFRRYSDFVDLYEALPGGFTSLMAPLPPKSWRSLSHLTMSPEFLEERRVGLETVLRRLLLQSTTLRSSEHSEDSNVSELVRSFLGMPCRPESMGGGLLWSVLPELELTLYTRPDILATPQQSMGKQAIHSAEDLRLSMWLILSGAARAARRASQEGLLGYYSVDITEDKGLWVGAGGREKDWIGASRHFEAIDVDVNRTYVRSDFERECLRRVLRSFALHLPDVGYCQAMNFVALFLLRTARGREDLSFWLLRALAIDVVPRYWEGTTSMARLHTDLAVLRKLALIRMSLLLSRLDAIGLPLELLACDWMLSLFCRVLPPITVLRVWDWLLLEGADVLIFVALAVLRFAEEDMLQVSGACASADKLTAIAAEIHDADELIDLAVSERDAILASQGSLKKLRGEQRAHQRNSSAEIELERPISQDTSAVCLQMEATREGFESIQTIPNTPEERRSLHTRNNTMVPINIMPSNSRRKRSAINPFDDLS